MSREATSAPPRAAADAELSRHTGRGGVAVSAAKGYFIVTGLVQQIALKGVLGLDGYGALSSALSAASIAYNPVVSASIQGVSHAVATASESRRPAALRRVLEVHAALALLLGGGFALLAPLIGDAAGAPHLVGALRLLGAVMFAYGLYAPLVGALNGARRFGAQAALDALAATLRTLGLIGGALWLGRHGIADGVAGVEGATAGFVLSATLVLGVAVTRVGVGQRGDSPHGVRSYLRYVLPILLGQVLLNLLFQSDALLLRRFAADAAVGAGLGATAADPLVGAYRAAQLFCFLPYQLVLSISLVIFPVIARAHASGSRAEVALYVRQGTRIALLVSGLLVSVTAGLPEALLTLVFGDDAARLGATAMTLLAPGLGTLALLGVLTAVLNSLGAQRLGLLVTGLAFALVVVLCVTTVRGQPFGAELLWRTARATTLGLLSASVVAGLLVRAQAGAVLAPASLLRVIASLVVALLLARSLPDASRLLTPVYALAVASTYVATLILTRELTSGDFRYVASVVGRGRPVSGD